MTRHTDSVAVIPKDRRRRRWTLPEKAALVRRTFEPGMGLSFMARQADLAAGLLCQWRPPRPGGHRLPMVKELLA